MKNLCSGSGLREKGRMNVAAANESQAVPEWQVAVEMQTDSVVRNS